MMTRLNSSIPCGQPDVEPSFLAVLELSLLSPTTLDLQINDEMLREEHSYHPGKCYMEDEEDDLYGALRILIQTCKLKNPDIESCFRKSNFPYPVKPDASTMKIDLWPTENGSWAAIDDYQRFRLSRSESEPGYIGLEVCAPKAKCVSSESLCVPAVTLVAQDPEAGSYKLTAGDMWNFTEYTTSSDIHSVVEEWEQPYALPDYGPYPPCPEDEKGRAMRCEGNETLTISIRKLTIDRAEVGSDGSVTFGVTYVLEWGDRFAVHPCTHNLFHIRTGGHPYVIPSSTYWTPTFTIEPAAKPPKIISAGKQLGVNLDFGKPVTDAVHSSVDVPWPKQLVLSRTYKVEHYPVVELDWLKFPFDSQDLSIVLSEFSVEPGRVVLDISNTEFSHEKTHVGDGWIKESVNFEKMSEDDMQALKLIVRVRRDPKGKVYTLFLPVLTLAVFEVAFNLIVCYSDTSGVFMTKAVTTGVAVSMTNPEVLGFPSSVSVMPYAQCFVLMVVLGTMFSSIMVLGRFCWENKIRSLSKEIDSMMSKFGAAVSTFGVDAPTARSFCFKEEEVDKVSSLAPGEGEYMRYHQMLVDKNKLLCQLKRYDMVIRAAVVVWYIVSFLTVSLLYGIIAM